MCGNGGHLGQQRKTIRTNSQAQQNFMKIGPAVSEKLFNNIMILYKNMYIAHGKGQKNLGHETLILTEGFFPSLVIYFKFQPSVFKRFEKIILSAFSPYKCIGKQI